MGHPHAHWRHDEKSRVSGPMAVSCPTKPCKTYMTYIDLLNHCPCEESLKTSHCPMWRIIIVHSDVDFITSQRNSLAQTCINCCYHYSATFKVLRGCAPNGDSITGEISPYPRCCRDGLLIYSCTKNGPYVRQYSIHWAFGQYNHWGFWILSHLLSGMHPQISQLCGAAITLCVGVVSGTWACEQGTPTQQPTIRIYRYML